MGVESLKKGKLEAPWINFGILISNNFSFFNCLILFFFQGAGGAPPGGEEGGEEDEDLKDEL